MGRAETPGLGGAAREPRPAPARMRAHAHWSTAPPRPPPGGGSRWEAVGRGNGRRRGPRPRLGRGELRFPTETRGARRVLEPGRSRRPPQGGGAAEGLLIGEKSLPRTDGGDGSRGRSCQVFRAGGPQPLDRRSWGRGRQVHVVIMCPEGSSQGRQGPLHPSRRRGCRAGVCSAWRAGITKT